MYTISEVAAKYGITTYTIRYYESQGLLPTVKRLDSGHRVFSDQDLELLEAILRGVKAGLTIHDMREMVSNFFSVDDVAARLDILFKRREELMKSIEMKKNALELLEKVIATYKAELEITSQK